MSYTALKATNEPQTAHYGTTATDEAHFNTTVQLRYSNGGEHRSIVPSVTAPPHSQMEQHLTNDLWIDTSDLENYPKLYKYNTAATLSSTNTSNQVAVTTSGAAWELVDKTDQTTEDGIVFADARLHTSAEKADTLETGGAGDSSSIKDLLSDNFLDPDAPNPDLFQGILLWNTRRLVTKAKKKKTTTLQLQNIQLSMFRGNIRQQRVVATYSSDG